MASEVTLPLGGPLTRRDGVVNVVAGGTVTGTSGAGLGRAGARIRIRLFADRQLLRSRRSRIRFVSSAHAISTKLPPGTPVGTVSVLRSRAKLPGLRARKRGRGRRRKSPLPFRRSRERYRPSREAGAVLSPAFLTVTEAVNREPGASCDEALLTARTWRSAFGAALATAGSARAAHTVATGTQLVI